MLSSLAFSLIWLDLWRSKPEMRLHSVLVGDEYDDRRSWYRSMTHHISRVKKINLISLFSPAKKCLEESRYCLESHKASFTARQSITICLVNYCWHILADGSICSRGDNDATEFLIFNVKEPSRRKMMISPESFAVWLIWWDYQSSLSWTSRLRCFVDPFLPHFKPLPSHCFIKASFYKLSDTFVSFKTIC